MKKTSVKPYDGLYACPACGCVDIEGTAWLHLNSGEVADGDPPSDDYWCPVCEEHHGHIMILNADGTAQTWDQDPPRPWTRGTVDEFERDRLLARAAGSVGRLYDASNALLGSLDKWRGGFNEDARKALADLLRELRRK